MICVRERLVKGDSTHLVFSVVMLEAIKNCVFGLSGLAVCLRPVRRGRKVLNTEWCAQCFEEFAQELCSTVGEEMR